MMRNKNFTNKEEYKKYFKQVYYNNQYDLDKTTYSFSRSDWGEVKLYNLVRFRES